MFALSKHPKMTNFAADFKKLVSRHFGDDANINVRVVNQEDPIGSNHHEEIPDHDEAEHQALRPNISNDLRNRLKSKILAKLGGPSSVIAQNPDEESPGVVIQDAPKSNYGK